MKDLERADQLSSRSPRELATRVKRRDWCSCVTMHYPKCNLCGPDGKVERIDWQASAEAAEQRVAEAEKERDEARAEIAEATTVAESLPALIMAQIKEPLVALKKRADRAEAAEQHSAQLRSALAELP